MEEHLHRRDLGSEAIEEIRELQKQNSMDQNDSRVTYSQPSNGIQHVSGIQYVSDCSAFENRTAPFFNQQNTMPQSEDFLRSCQFTPPNLQFQPHFGLNRVNAPYPPSMEQHRSGYSYESPLNSHMANPYVESRTPILQNKSKRKPNVPKVSNNSQNDPLPQHRNWTVAEDVGLTKAYLNISIDATIGKDQTKEKLWARIIKVWQNNMTKEYDKTRAINALMCRWSAIQLATTKFHALYESLERAPRSGTSIEDMKEEAMKMYKSLMNQPFRYLHCWEVLRKNAKWCTLQLTRTGCSKKQKVNDNSVPAPSSSTPITIVGDECDDANIQQTVEVTNGDGVTRPPGRDSSKDKKKKKSEEKGLVDVLGNIQCALEKQFDLNQEDLEFQKNHEKRANELREEALKRELELKEQAQRKKLELKEQAQIKEFKLKEKAQLMKEKAMKRKEDSKILNMDLDSLQPLAREAYRMLQAQIMKEWENEGLFGDFSGSGNREI